MTSVEQLIASAEQPVLGVDGDIPVMTLVRALASQGLTLRNDLRRDRLVIVRSSRRAQPRADQIVRR